MKKDSDTFKEEEREEDKTGERETKIIIIVIISIKICSTCLKNKESEKTLVQVTLDISQEIIDQIELGECCKICYINDEPPLIRIRKEGKEDIITHKFSIGKPYKESVDTTPKKSKDKAYDLVHIEDKNHPTLGDPDECGSY